MGTIAGIVSAVAMALVGAISSYISYQKKKLCFSIQRKFFFFVFFFNDLTLSPPGTVITYRGFASIYNRLTGKLLIKCVITESLNAEMVKAENPDAVVATEPQGNTRI